MKMLASASLLKKTSLVSILFIQAALSGCSGHYLISTNDGHMIKAHGKPYKDKDTGLILYKDADGSRHELHSKDVKEIAEE
ncbi:UNVERIFIED_ORG: hypothetical protein FHW05_004794 [Pantoea agglomerans]